MNSPTAKCLVPVVVLGLLALFAACNTPTSTGSGSGEPAPGGLPDLTLTSVTGPANATRGSTVNVIYVTRNLSNDMANPFATKFYLTNAPVASTVSFVNTINEIALAGNTSRQATNTQFVIPSNAKLGTNYVIVVTAIGIMEVNKSNNTNTSCKINIQ